MAYNADIALGLLKSRLNRLASDTSLDGYLAARIEAADRGFIKKGINLSADSADDAMLLADFTAWAYSNRDKPQGTPEWLRLAIRERWLAQRGRAGDDFR